MRRQSRRGAAQVWRKTNVHTFAAFDTNILDTKQNTTGSEYGNNNTNLQKGDKESCKNYSNNAK